MTKRNKIVYWIATTWLALGMVSTGLAQLFKLKDEAGMMGHLGYPLYLLTILCVCKIFGIVTILIPAFPLLKEWANAGFFFALPGAVFSHLTIVDSAKYFFGPMLLLLLMVDSWYFRPADRKIILINQ